MTDLKAQIRDYYGNHAKNVGRGSSCCGGSSSYSCGSSIGMGNYEAKTLETVPDTAALASAGCGNPTMLASIRQGEVVLDLGSGGGLDALISAQRVGPEGKVYGIDMTPEMLALARANAAKAGIGNVEFLKGDIEQIPLPDNSVDVIISNCVINLALDKTKVFGEAYRVLKPGGRLAVSDIMFDGDRAKLPADLLEQASVWASCVGGALEVEEYKTHLTAAGFEDVSVQITTNYDIQSLTSGCCGSGPKESYGCSSTSADVAIVSGFARATKPNPLWVSEPTTIAAAELEDLGDILGLLVQHDLPTAGVSDHLDGFVVARQGSRIVGVCGTERYGEIVLLRSVAVAASQSGRGLGKKIVSQVLDDLRNVGVKETYLLTTTASGFFGALGFEQVHRNQVPDAISATAEFRDLCPCSAAVMTKRLS